MKRSKEKRDQVIIAALVLLVISGSVGATSATYLYSNTSVNNAYAIETTDSTIPSIVITQPAANSNVMINTGTITLTGTASDSGSGVRVVQVRVDGGSYFTAAPKAAGDWSTWSVALPITSGQHRLVPRATDTAGN